ncbi:MAG: 16S rRNA (cytosine(1402)-N(4))-methyltransferase RsmH [Bacteroidales bacterium]|nr:16S rRNA (cytosine(1402)-N(4))-methyltransferase RsmH [Bacteroidales bacterium]MBQ8461184.1 16S rRNA (cytosine(1402)-N(4))-methyltransferase RsmH [Bacteroidales bacterium]MCR5364338.1 16S rRNA (cytosine(1402)-N(4))-methyltransferase RsmH [Bacteroidales bacterium]
MSEYHIPVLLEKSVSTLVTNPSGLYIDATFGGGGHTAGILSRLDGSGKVIAFDRDTDALKNAPNDERLILVHNNFRFVQNYLELLSKEKGLPAKADGVLADLGVSSHQFDTPERGFSFRYDAPLDMRMNTQAPLSAADIVNTYEAADLERILRLYGEVDKPGRLANLIVSARAKAAIATTGDLDKALAPALPKLAEHKFLAKVYQALRIEVNQEMRSLEKFLKALPAVVAPGGRLAIITYHSLEDRMVKNFIKTGNVDGRQEKDVFGRMVTPFEALDRKPVLPSEEEIQGNTRARSAKLRTAVRV